MMAPVLGHAFSIFHGFHGGKAIAVSFGVLLGLYPQMKAVLILVCYYLLFSVIRISPHWKRSIITYLCFGITAFCLVEERTIVLGCIGIALTVIGKHISSVKCDSWERLKIKKEIDMEK